jgi:hypothetical protein
MWNLPSIDLADPQLFMTHELLDAGYDQKMIFRMTASGDLHRISQGAYAIGDHWRGLDIVGRRVLTSRAMLQRSRVPTLLSGPSAADVLGTPVWDMGDEVHVTRLDGRADRRHAGRAPHRGTVLAEDMTIRHGLPLTSGTKTALDVITMTDIDRALVVVDGLLFAGETTIPLLERRRLAMSHDPHSLNFPLVLQRADGRHESAGETRADSLMFYAHLPRPTPQFEVRDRWGQVVARVDFAWPQLGVFMEFDGKVKYLRFRRKGESIEDAVLREKRREELICGLTGWRCIRITWSDLHHRERTIARIEATLAGRVWDA